MLLYECEQAQRQASQRSQCAKDEGECLEKVKVLHFQFIFFIICCVRVLGQVP